MALPATVRAATSRPAWARSMNIYASLGMTERPEVGAMGSGMVVPAQGWVNEHAKAGEGHGRVLSIELFGSSAVRGRARSRRGCSRGAEPSHSRWPLSYARRGPMGEVPWAHVPISEARTAFRAREGRSEDWDGAYSSLDAVVRDDALKSGRQLGAVDAGQGTWHRADLGLQDSEQYLHRTQVLLREIEARPRSRASLPVSSILGGRFSGVLGRGGRTRHGTPRPRSGCGRGRSAPARAVHVLDTEPHR